MVGSRTSMTTISRAIAWMLGEVEGPTSTSAPGINLSAGSLEKTSPDMVSSLSFLENSASYASGEVMSPGCMSKTTQNAPGHALTASIVAIAFVRLIAGSFVSGTRTTHSRFSAFTSLRATSRSAGTQYFHHSGLPVGEIWAFRKYLAASGRSSSLTTQRNDAFRRKPENHS